MIIAVIPLLTDGGNDDKPQAMPRPSVQASKTPGKTVPPATATPPTNQPTESGSSDVPAPSVSSSSDSKAIQYTGPVRIANAGPDLDVVPPKIGLGDPDPDVVIAPFDPSHIDAYSVVNEPRLALWTGSAMPNRRDCSDLLSTQGGTRVEVKKGTVVCVRTDAGRIAVLTVTSTSDDSDTGDRAQATVWSEVSD
ncbi:MULTISPECIES: hypothetical protein [Streptomyces]|uniref:Serine/threonine protein kinase n=1 Tax=Streptomyces flaveolus TaxID=67297 RepID=A0ABV3AJS3_9ACTN|nr:MULTISPECIES: hypothetical protein [Streptomyces]